MHRLPLADELPYQFYPPKVSRFWTTVGGPVIRHLMRKRSRVESIEFQGVEHLRDLIGKGDGILLAPNHCDHGDCPVTFELGRKLGLPFCYMAAYQIFAGVNRWFLPRLGAFPVDREGSDLRAYKAGVEVLTKAEHPLVVFPEGEIYHMADRLTPLREGAAALAVTAARRLADAGKTAWIVPAAIKYRFLDGFDPLPALHELMTDLEARFTWWPDPKKALMERLYAYAGALIALKEMEYFGEARPGPLKDRIAALRTHILDTLDLRHFGKPHADPVPVRVKDLRHACLEALANPDTTPERVHELRGELNDLFVAVQLYSYPGDYVRQCPTVERVAEILTKFEQDVLGPAMALPRGPRRAIMRLGPPINVGERLKVGGKPRAIAGSLTNDLESRIQGLLDAIGPGRPLDLEGGEIGAPTATAVSMEARSA